MYSAFAGLAGQMITQKMNERAQQKMAAQQQQWTRENMDAAFQYSQKAQQQAPSNTVHGLRMAGLSPALALNGGSFQAASMAPLAGAGGHVDTPSSSLASDDAALTLAGAQADLLQAQAQKTRVEVENMESENAATDLNLRNWLQKQVDDVSLSSSEKAFYQSMLDNEQSYTVGSLKGLQNYINLDVQQKEAVDKKMQAKFNAELNSAKLNERVPEWLAKMPEKEVDKLSASISQIYTNTLLLASDVSLTEDKRRQMQSEISKNIALANSITHGDFAQLVNNGDTQSLFVGTARDILETVLSFTAVGGAMKAASMLSKGAKVARAGKSAVKELGEVEKGLAAKSFKGGKGSAVSSGYKPPASLAQKNASTLKTLSFSWGDKAARQKYDEYMKSGYSKKDKSFDDYLKDKGIFKSGNRSAGFSVGHD